MEDYQRICICNAIYKFVTKAIPNRLKTFLDSMVLQIQSTFLANRLITNNVIIAYEITNTVLTT